MNGSSNSEAILYAFAVEPSHDQQILQQYLDKYPELADELIDLSFELRLMRAEGSAQTVQAEDVGAESAWEQFVSSGASKATPAKKTGTFLSNFRGAAFAEFAARVKLPRTILIAFRDRLVEPMSIPERILRQLADAAELSLKAVKEYLAHPPLVIETAQFKSDNKPAPQGRISFRKLIESTELPAEEREALLQECPPDGLDRG